MNTSENLLKDDADVLVEFFDVTAVEDQAGRVSETMSKQRTRKNYHSFWSYNIL